MAESGCLKDVKCQNMEISGRLLGGKRNIINIAGQTGATNLSVKDSGALIMLSGVEAPAEIPTVSDFRNQSASKSSEHVT